MESPDTTEVSCVACKLLIPEGASVCTHCQSHQGLLRFIPISDTALALIIALFSTVSTSVIALHNTFHTPTSEAFISSTEVDGTTLRLIAVNTGDAPAVISEAWIKNRYLAPATRIKLRDDHEAIIPPGSKIIILDVVPLLDEVTSHKISLKAFEYQVGGIDPDATLTFKVTQSDGSFHIQSRPMTIDEFHDIFRANADRCSAIDEPNYENGCIGNGMSPDEFLGEESIPTHTSP